MSYNVDDIKTLSGSLRISRENLGKVQKFLDHRERFDLPESNFLTPLLKLHERDEEKKFFEIPKLLWRGEGSGYAFEDLLALVLPLTEGTLEAVVTWERGDSVNGIRVVDGKVTRHEVEMKLGKQIK